MNPLWPTIVAVAIFLLMGAVTLTAMRRYTFEQAMKIWQAQVGLLGTIIGMIGTFFFANVQISNLSQARDEAESMAAEAVQVREYLAAELGQTKHDLRVAQDEAERFKTASAYAEKQKGTLYPWMIDPAFTNILRQYSATTQPTTQDIEELIHQHTVPEDSVP